MFLRMLFSPLDFPNKIPYPFLISPMCATSSVDFTHHDLIILIAFGEKPKIWSS
jgi:hypothetical protein